MAYYTGSNLTDLQSARTAENLSARQAATQRALAAMQAMSEVGRQSSAERIAGQSAANEAMRLNNALALGREQYGSNERVAGLNNANAATIAGLERASRLELGQLPFSPEAREHALAVARLGVRPDPYMTRDIGQANLESLAMNDLAKSLAESVNLQIDREEAELLKDLPGPDWWNKDAKIKDGITKILTGMDAKLGENRQLLEFVPATNRYKPRVRAIIPIPNGQPGPTPTSPPAVPPLRPNQSLLTPPSYATPPMSYDGTAVVPPLPNRAMMDASVPIGSVPVVPSAAVAAQTTAVPTVPITRQIADDFARTRLPVLDRPTPDEAFVRNVTSPMTYASPLLSGILNAYQAIQGYGGIPKADPTAFGAQGSAPGYRPPTGSVAVPTASTNAIAADLAKLATLGPVPPGTTSTNRATGMTYQFNGSTWQPLPR